MDYFDQIMQETGLIGTGLALAGSTAGSALVKNKINKTVTGNYKFPIDKNIKKLIEKKVKLTMKINKIKEKDSKNEILPQLNNELKIIEKTLKDINSSLKSEEKELCRKYENKCELDFGPKSIYYFSIRIPKTVKEAMNDLIDDEVMTESADKVKEVKKQIVEKIQSSVKDAGLTVKISKESLNSFLNGGGHITSDTNNLCLSGMGEDNYEKVFKICSNIVKDDKNFKIIKDNYWTLFLSVKPNSPYFEKECKESVYSLVTDDFDYLIESDLNDNEDTSFQDDNTLDEFSIGNMLPICGSTDGVGNPKSVIKDINKVNKHADKDDLNGIELPDDIEIESVMQYIKEPDLPFDIFVENAISNFVDRVKVKSKISNEIRKVIMAKASIKAKLRIAKIKKADPTKIDSLKKELISKEKELRIMKKGLDTETISEIEEFSKNLDKAFNTTIEKETLKINSFKKKESTVKESSMDEEVYDVISYKKDLQTKLESAMERNDLYAINAYQNKLKYVNICEAANIDPEIKPVIDLLNKKGYKTKYSSAGHTKLRRKDDNHKDGVYYGKLYSDARIMFDSDYDFPKAPKHWVWKNVDGKDYLDIIPIVYNEKDGTPNEAFQKWKNNYMDTLRTWVDNLPDKSKSDNKIITKNRKNQECINESGDSIFTEKKTREQYRMEQFKKKYNFEPDDNGKSGKNPNRGYITVDGKKYHVDIGNSNYVVLNGTIYPRETEASLLSDEIILSEEFFKLKNNNRREGILQHEIGHQKYHSILGDMKNLDEESISDEAFKSIVKGLLNSEGMQLCLSEEEFNELLNETLKKLKNNRKMYLKKGSNNKYDKSKILADIKRLIKKENPDKNSKAETRKELISYIDGKYTSKIPHNNTNEVEADLYARNKVGKKDFKKGLKEFGKHSLSDKLIKKRLGSRLSDTTPENIEEQKKISRNSLDSDFKRRSKILDDNDLYMKARSVYNDDNSSKK